MVFKLRSNDESDNYSQFVEDFIKINKIEIKSDEEVNKMSKKERKEYDKRVKGWMALLDTHIEFEIHSGLNFFKMFDLMFKHIYKKAEELRVDPNYDELYKEMVERSEWEAKQFYKHLVQQRKAFDEIYIPYKKQKTEELLNGKEEDIKSESDSDTDIDINEDNVSEELK